LGVTTRPFVVEIGCRRGEGDKVFSEQEMVGVLLEKYQSAIGRQTNPRNESLTFRCRRTSEIRGAVPRRWTPPARSDNPRVTSYEAGIHPHFTLLCDDIRFEVGNRFSLMGVFHSITAAELPLALLKVAVVTYLHGEGTANAEVRILSPDRSEIVMASQAALVDLSAEGSTYNVNFFVNVVFQREGTYWVQILLNSEVASEVPLAVVVQRQNFY